MTKVLVSERDAAAALGFSLRWLQERRLAGAEVPPHVRIGRRIMYRPSDLEAWAVERLGVVDAAPSPFTDFES